MRCVLPWSLPDLTVRQVHDYVKHQHREPDGEGNDAQPRENKRPLVFVLRRRGDPEHKGQSAKESGQEPNHGGRPAVPRLCYYDFSSNAASATPIAPAQALYYDSTMSEAVRPTLRARPAPEGESAPETDAGFLWDFWYPAVRSSAITGHRLVKAMLLEVPLVLGRTSEGKAFAMRDACPHRGIPLSYGHFDGKTVECSYHGWRFEACTGQCVEIPSLTGQDKLKVDRIFAGHFPCEERDGYIWVYMHEPGKKPATIPAAPALALFSEKYRITHLECGLPCHIDHGIIGLMDPAHGPFVHQSWFWRKRASIHEKQKQFEPIPNGFRMSPHTPSSNSAPYQLLKKITGETVTTTIDFELPNLRTEIDRSGKLWFSSRAVVTPVRRDLCRIDFVAAWNIPFPVSLFRIFGRKFLRQDQETMIKQAEGLKTNPNLMLIDDADRQAKWYFALKANLLESRRTGEPIVHPMSGPVTLRWRS
jgi:phenylpropionate dioxygenase-like ring-hydroxylating dioxygenase large terminal subunit